MTTLESLLEYIKNPQIYKFMIVGIGSAIFVLVFTVVFTSMLHIFYAVSVAILIEAAIIWGFFVHDKWTFGNLPKTVQTKIRFAKYNVLSLTGLGVNEFVLILLTEKAGINYLQSEFIAIIVTFLFNFSVHKKISWKY